MDESQYFNESHHAVRDMVRRFAREEVAPIARQFDESGTFPWETVKKMGDLGLLGMPWDEELGGAGFDLIGYLLAIYEMAKVDASHAITISAHTTLGTSPIVNFGSEAQKRRLGGFGLTEEAAGSDAGGTRTTAVRRGDRWILNGSKRFITHGGVGEIFVVTAQTDPSKGTKGITSFILTKESCDPEAARRVGLTEPSLPRMAGFKAGRKEDKLGWRASDTRELIFEDVEVPDENVLGQPGMGFTNFMRTLDAGRIGIAALSLGLAEGAFEEALRYAHVRKQFGKPIYDFQGVSFPLADMAMEIEAGKHLMFSAARIAMTGRPYSKEAAMAKLFCSELAMRATVKAIQIHGGYGYTKEYPVERMMRDAKICEIGEGTSEIQRLVISRQIAKELAD